MADMRRYEAMMLTVPEITKDEATDLEKGFATLVRDAKGDMVSFERWGKYRLAYPVDKNDYGVYFLARFELPEGHGNLDEFKSYFAIKVNDFVMRSMMSRLDSSEPLDYQRPRSLEEAPTSRDVDSFLKENKMEGLLPSSGAKPLASSASSAELSLADSEEDVDDMTADEDNADISDAQDE